MAKIHDFNKKIREQKCKMMAYEIADHINLEPIVYNALVKTERELFVPTGMSHQAYKLDALPLSSNQWISSPLTVAKMTQALNPLGVDSILEVGCGSGYQAAVLSSIVRRVFTIERIEKLLLEAKTRFNKLEINNIHARFDDGQRGWRSYAPFDRILFSASTPKVPENLFEQLKDGGILVAPIEKNKKQVITQFKKEQGKIQEFQIDECLFVPVKDGTIR